MVAPLTTCSARIRVFSLVISAFIPQEDRVGLGEPAGAGDAGLYVAGMVSALGVAFHLPQGVLARAQSEPFIMELPAYKAPDAKNVARNVLLRAEMFLKRAGTTILSMAILIWFLASVPRYRSARRGRPSTTPSPA